MATKIWNPEIKNSHFIVERHTLAKNEAQLLELETRVLREEAVASKPSLFPDHSAAPACFISDGQCSTSN